MKKIRLLALLLALLMIPFGMLFACKENDEDTDDDGDGDDSDTTTTAPTPVASEFTVDDGKASGSFLVFFDFDKAPDGQIGIIEPQNDVNHIEYSDFKPTQPYATYFTGSIVTGDDYHYIVKNPTPSNIVNPNKYLEIQRTKDKATSVAMDFKTKDAGLTNTSQATYTIEFKLDYSEGLFGSDGIVSGLIGTTAQTFLTIGNNAIYDCNKVAIYGEKDSDYRGWIKIALVINDKDREYDVYIDSGEGYVRQTFGVDYNADKTKYPAHSEESCTEKYRFAISTSKPNNTYFRIDELGIRPGNEITSIGSDAVSVYTDKVDSKYAMVAPNIAGIKSFLAAQPHITNGLKTELFYKAGDVLLSDRITISKINYTNEKYADIAAFYDKAIFTRTLSADEQKNPDAPENKINKFILDTKNKKAYFYKNLTTDTAIVADYTVGSGNNSVITFTWKNYSGTMPKTARFTNNVLTTYADDNTKIATYKFDYSLNDNVIDVVHDYGALLGYYSENSVFKSEKNGTYTVTSYNNKFVYTLDGVKYNGTYAVGDNGVITFNIKKFTRILDGELVRIEFIDDDELKVIPVGGTATVHTYGIEDDVITINAGEGEEPYGYIKYSVDDEAYVLYSDAECTVKIDTLNEKLEDKVVYAKYDKANGTLSVYSDATCEAEKLVATYNLEAPEEIELDEAKKNERYGIKFINFDNIQTTEKTTEFTSWDNKFFTMAMDNLSSLKFGIYVPDEMYAAGDVFTLVLWKDASNYQQFVFKPAEAGKEMSISGNIIYYAKGLNEVELDISKMGAVGQSAAQNAVKLLFKYEYVEKYKEDNTDKERTLKKTSKIPFYITAFEWIVQDVVVEVAGPGKDKPLDCDHTNYIGDPTLVKIKDPIPGNCHYATYYIEKCTVCDAEFVDNTKIGYITQKHEFSGEPIVVEPTCDEDGYTYNVCVHCGEKYVYDVKLATGHDSVAISIVGKNVIMICKHCGIITESAIFTEMMSYDEKLSILGVNDSDRKNWQIKEDSKLNLKGNGRIGGPATVTIQTANTATNMRAEDTVYGKMLLIEGGKDICESYIDIISGNGTDTFFKEQNFVYEFDFMKGNPSASGTYAHMRFGIGWRNGPITYSNWGALYMKYNGGIQLAGYGQNIEANDKFDNNTKEFMPEQGVLYNIAVHHNLATNTVTLYIDGVKWDECQFLASVEDSMIFGVTHIRIRAGGVPTGSQYYIDNYVHYAADEQPICVLTTDFMGGLDFEGEIGLQDEIKNPMLKDFSVTENGVDVDFFVPGDISLGLAKQKYTLEFSIDGSTLKAGTLLKAKKVGFGETVKDEEGQESIILNGGYYRYADLLTTDGLGNLYVFGTLVYKGEEGSTGFNNLKIAFAFDDNAGTLQVYINGSLVPVTISYDGEFALSNGVIRGFTLDSECGAYFVSGLKMYTGKDVQ